MSSDLKNKIEDKTAQISVIGAGYVGLPLAVAFASAGFNVSTIDNDESKVNTINSGESYITDISSESIKRLSPQISSGATLTATTEYSSLATSDCVIICVPTPVSKTKDPDVSFIIDATNSISKYIHEDMLVVLESTTYPGTTEEIIVPMLENSENGTLEIGRNIFVAFSPERIDPNNQTWTVIDTPKVLGGITKACTEIGVSLYKSAIQTLVPVSSTKVAEMVKLLENTYRATNIGLVNEIAIMCEKLKVNAWEVIDASGTKPFGFMKFTPGPGLGGHCIPIDPHYLAWKMRTLDYKARFIELAGQINSAMPEHVVELIRYSLNDLAITIKNSNILLIGMAYKKDIDDVRESPSLDIMALLEEQGAMVDYYDPYISEIKWNSEIKKGYLNLSEINLDSYSAIVILTDHTNINYDKIKNSSTLIIDTRNVYENSKSKNIVRLGFG